MTPMRRCLAVFFVQRLNHKKQNRRRILNEAETSGSHVAGHYAPILIPFQPSGAENRTF
jgi:hypothetical protein